METRETERSPKEAANLNGIRRKLRSQRGVTVVFALVIFLIMALFSYVMVNASLTAVQGAAAGQFDQQAYLSTRSVAFMIYNTLKQYNFTVTDDGVWTNETTGVDTFAPLYQLQNQFGKTSVWKITGTGLSDEVKQKFGVVKVKMKPDFPSVIVELEHFDRAESTTSNYKMTVTITGTVSPPDSNTVTFQNQNATMTAQQGVS